MLVKFWKRHAIFKSLSFLNSWSYWIEIGANWKIFWHTFLMLHIFCTYAYLKYIFTAYAQVNAESDVNRGAQKVVQKLRQHVAAEYPKKQYQSLLRHTEAGIVMGEGHKKYLKKKTQ